LRPRRERPCRRAAEKGDELTSPDAEHGFPRMIVLNCGGAPSAPPELKQRDSTTSGWQTASCIAGFR
jgi:hypothetical protein